ncbi:MAG: nickel/cobalt transporter [Blastococcus sp.]
MRRRLAAVALAAAACWIAVPGGVAQAHPLGNFTVNHYDHVQLFPHRIALTAVVDQAEIPTAQALQSIAPDGHPSAEQLAAGATSGCAELALALTLTVDGRPVTWRSEDDALEMLPGAAGLPTLRLTCQLGADADLDSAARVAFDDAYLTDRVGWREVTADGDGVRLIHSPVPVASISDELRRYPRDLLTSPVDIRSFTVATEPGTNTGAGAAIAPARGDPFSGGLAALDRRLESVIGDRGLTPVVGVLAVLLTVLLGSGHALLPGHGKAVMAAYLAGRRGRTRDAVIVGATVTATHTVGVLVLGLALSFSSSLAGEQVLRWLGVGSGLLVAGIGVFLLRSALLRWRTPPASVVPAPDAVPDLALAGAHHVVPAAGHVHLHAGHDHHHDHHHGHSDAHGHTHGRAAGRGGLVGMGIAGGLVPSPSALIVLLASVGLGRTVFGIVLVLAYGLGMATTLTAVGVLLVRWRGRLDRRASGRPPAHWLSRLAAAAPVLTASLVLLVGLALVTRGIVLGA